jgi:hypothetical protein
VKKSFIGGIVACLVAMTQGGCWNTTAGTGATSTGSIPAGTTTFSVSVENAPSSYTINNLANPSMTLQRGQTYTFNVNTPNHPFYIMTVQSTDTGNAYSGATSNGMTNGTMTFSVPTSAPAQLYYNCSNHAAMTGVITITN